MHPLHRKLFRDLAGLKGQATAIAVVVAAGVMVLIVFVTTLDSLTLTQERYYEAHRFAHVFAGLKRAPNSVGARIRDLSGVDQVETRIRAPIRMEVAGFADPIRGDLVSLPDGRNPLVNRLYLRAGVLPYPGRWNEVAVNEVFAEAHNLRIGDAITAVIRGRMEELIVSAIVLSPEFIYQLGPGDLVPDYQRYGVLWMNERALAHAFGMDGAFNSVVLTLQPGASADRVIDALDELLAPYGGIGAHGRDDQLSHRFIAEELDQIRAMAAFLPAVFMGVAAFLLHVLMGRIIRMQREQIALLKAFGYTHREIATHFGMLTGIIVLAGSAVGIALGAWAADAMARLYADFFRFPEMHFRLQTEVVLLALGVAGGAALLGAFAAVRGAVRLPPAEAMRPPVPEHFRRGWIERGPLWQVLDQPTRIILRNLARHRLKAGLSILGIAVSCALLLVGSYQFHAVDDMIDVQYRLIHRMDLHLTFTEPTPERAEGELRHAPGVLQTEGYRAVPVRLRQGTRSYQTTLLGLEERPALRGLIDRERRPVAVPPEGLLLTAYLADYLGVGEGDRLRVEIMEGHRRTVEVPLARVVEEPIGVSAYMDRRALNRLLGEGPALSGVWLLADRSQDDVLFPRLREMARVAGIGLVGDAEAKIRAHIDQTVLAFMSIVLLLASSIAFAVIYNNARIALAERTRELATLRVLGFSQGEVAYILIGEIVVLTALAIPVGWVLGTGLAWGLSTSMSTDIFRIPFVITRWTYGFAAAGVLAASVVTALLVLPRLRRIDMVTALKAGE